MYKEYYVEDGKKVDLVGLRSERIDKRSYALAHKSLPIICHDAYIKYREGVLLVERKNFPAKNIHWPIGGRVERGTHVEESLKKKVKEECSLDLKNIKFLGVVRHFFRTDPFGHGKGTDTPTLVFSAEGEGKLKLNAMHINPEIVVPEKYNEKFRLKLHPYVRDFMDIVIKQIKR